MSEELKPCPFCGQSDMLRIGKIEGPGSDGIMLPPEYWAWCERCDTSTENRLTIDEAVAVWNRRPIEDALRAELEQALTVLRGERERSSRIVNEGITYRLKAEAALAEVAELRAFKESVPWQALAGVCVGGSNITMMMTMKGMEMWLEAMDWVNENEPQESA
jgi:hypothetical protein